MTEAANGDVGEHLENLGRFYANTGHRVVETSEQCLWIARRPPLVFNRVPHYDLTQPSKQALTRLFRTGPAAAVHYACEPSPARQANASLLVLQDREYGLAQLSANTRSKVRRGLKQCQVRRIGADELAGKGYALLCDLYGRTMRQPASRARYEGVFCVALAAARFTEIWGAFVEEELAAYVVSHRLGATWFLTSRASHQRHHRTYANNALLFTVLHSNMHQPGIEAVYDTFTPLEASASIEDFKRSMGLAPVPIVRCFAAHPLLRPAVNRVTQRVCHWVARKQPRNVVARKAAAALDAVLGA